MKRLMKRLPIAVVLIGAVVALGLVVMRLTADEAETAEELVIVIDEVDTMTLQDTVVLRGQVEREASFTLTAGGNGRVTSISVEEEAVVNVGDELLRINGRPMVAIDDAVPYWRPLSRFIDDGPDVERLEQFLVDEGYSPGTVNQEFTDVTRDALEDWQADNGYPTDGVFLPTDVATGEWPATVGGVDLEVGATVVAGQALVPFVDDELAVSVQVDPTDRSRLESGLVATVTIPATGAEGTGEISELAENAEIDPQGVERYRGEVRLDGDLGVVEGTAVRVEVILEEVTNALVVPVAAVSLNGDGEEEVRILNRAGELDRVFVETGLTEGAMVEIVSGLDGGEQVVVEVRGE